MSGNNHYLKNLHIKNGKRIKLKKDLIYERKEITI